MSDALPDPEQTTTEQEATEPSAPEPSAPDHMADAARTEAARARMPVDHPEPSLGARLGQVGVLGWMIVTPMLVAVFLGRWIDHRMETGIFFSAPMLLLGAVIGFHSAWHWMHRHL